MAKLDGYYTFTHPESGVSQTFGPNDDLPDWVDTSPDHVGTGESKAVDQDADDYEVAGPGLHEGEAERLEEEAKAEARRAADRDRKAKQRAGAKNQTAAQLKAAAEAEEKRKAEETAAAEKAQADAAAQGGGQ
jgi:hypothetical protein